MVTDINNELSPLLSIPAYGFQTFSVNWIKFFPYVMQWKLRYEALTSPLEYSKFQEITSAVSVRVYKCGMLNELWLTE
jgi:hypothetical protein